MHPISKENNKIPNFGIHGIAVNFYSVSSTAIVAGYIVKQVGTDTFMVSDVTPAPGVKIKGKKCRLAPTLAIANNLALAANQSYFTMTVSTVGHTAGTGATFTSTYGVDSALIGAGGTGYVAGNTLTLTGSGGATIVVDTVTGGVVTTYHIGAPGSMTALLTSPVAVTGGAGTGATFGLKYKLLSIAAAGGSGYQVGDTLSFAGTTATTLPAAHVASIGPVVVTVDSPGAGINVVAAPTGVGTGTQHVRHIWDTKLMTLEGQTMKWTRNSSVNGSAFLASYS